MVAKVPCSNILQYRVLSGNFNELSRQLVRALCKRGLWTERIRSDILAAHGMQRLDPVAPRLTRCSYRVCAEREWDTR